MPRPDLENMASKKLTHPLRISWRAALFPPTFFLACLAALELDGVALEEI
jgi:hypothetical protein